VTGEIVSASSRTLRFHPRSAIRLKSCDYSEPEAAAVHCAHLTDVHQLKPSQIFMICDAGGGTVVRLGLTFWATFGAPDSCGFFHRILPSIKFWVSCKTLRLQRCARVPGQIAAPYFLIYAFASLCERCLLNTLHTWMPRV
jgi:hypothetical protein